MQTKRLSIWTAIAVMAIATSSASALVIAPPTIWCDEIISTGCVEPPELWSDPSNPSSGQYYGIDDGNVYDYDSTTGQRTNEGPAPSYSPPEDCRAGATCAHSDEYGCTWTSAWHEADGTTEPNPNDPDYLYGSCVSVLLDWNTNAASSTYLYRPAARLVVGDSGSTAAVDGDYRHQGCAKGTDAAGEFIENTWRCMEKSAPCEVAQWAPAADCVWSAVPEISLDGRIKEGSEGVVIRVQLFRNDIPIETQLLGASNG